MNITIITPFLPFPLNSGGAQAQFNIINELRTAHNIMIICPENGKNKQRYFKQLQARWPEVHIVRYPYFRQLIHLPFLKDKTIRAYKLKTRPNDERFQVERALKPYGFYLSRDFVNFVNSHIRQHQTHLVEVNFYPYLNIVRSLPSDVKTLFVQHEIRYIRNKRLLEPLKLTENEKTYFEEIKQEEIKYLNLYDKIISLTQTDKDIMHSDGVTVPIAVSPAAVNTPILPHQSWNGKITFIGGYSHIPNQEGMNWFITHVLPSIRTDCIKSIDVVGAGWPQHYNTLNPKLHFLGFVEKLEDAISGSLLIVPILTGSGMRMKILDAAAMGVPFITTSVGVEGLDFRHNESCVIADSAIDFAEAINQLITNADKMLRLACTAQNIFKEKYSVEALSNIRNSIYQQCL